MSANSPADDNSDPAPPARSRGVGFSLGVSLLVHGALLAVLVAVPYHYYYAGRTEPTGSSGGSDPTARPAPSGVSSPAEITGERVDAKLTEVLSQVDKLSTEEKLEKLEGTAKQLDKVTSEKTVDELAGLFQGWLGTEKRATAPTPETPGAKPTGAFQIESAQFHDVTRTKDASGRWRYKSVLVDSAGRTMEVELDPAEGETVYKTFQILKANPLAEKIYRQVTMPILDKLSKAAREAEKLALEAERQKQSAEAKEPPKGANAPR